MAATVLIVALVLILRQGSQAPAPEGMVPSASASAAPVLALERSRCVDVGASGIPPRMRDLGYTTIQQCSGEIRNTGSATIDAPDVWVDQLDASGTVIGSCRGGVAGGPLATGERREWTVACVVTPAATKTVVRFTAGSGAHLPSVPSSEQR